MNPYESPREDFEKAPAASVPLRALRGPSLGLFSLAGIHLLFELAYLSAVILGIAISLVRTAIRSPARIPNVLQGVIGDLLQAAPYIVPFVLGFLVSALSCVVIFRGALGMRRGENYRRARLAAILSCIPFLSPIMYCGIPFGIWALLVLRRPEVRAEFERTSESQLD